MPYVALAPYGWLWVAMGSPGGPGAKTRCSQRRGPGFDPSSGNLTPQTALRPGTAKEMKLFKKERHTRVQSQGFRKFPLPEQKAERKLQWSRVCLSKCWADKENVLSIM